MNVWLLSEVLVTVALGLTLLLRSRIGTRFEPLSLMLCSLLLLICIGQWATEGSSIWTLGLGALGLALLLAQVGRRLVHRPD